MITLAQTIDFSMKVADKAGFSDRQKLELAIDNYNFIQSMKWFGKKYIDKNEILKEYDEKNK